MKIFTKCCDQQNPIGITEPYFSWIITECEEKKQVSYHIKVYSPDEKIVWDSKTITSDNSVYIKYDGDKLEENTKYFWEVTVATEAREITSEKSHFITGLYNTSSLKWISADKDVNSPIIHKEFTLDKIGDYATLNICGLGFFEVYINGKKVSDDLMSPVRTDYDKVNYKDLSYPYTHTTTKSVKYLTYEVASLLQEGENKISVWLGNGWYRQNGRTVEGTFDYGSELKLFFRLTSDKAVIESDLDCYFTESPIVYDNIFYGEIYDARIKGSKKPVHETAPPAARLEPQLSPAERVIDTFIPHFNNGVYDAGKCMTGFSEISFTGKAGDRVEIYYAEDINDSNELDYTSTVGYVDSDKDQIQKDTYILYGDDQEVYVPRFVWHAFRYFKIVASPGVTINNVKVHYVSTDLHKRSSFSTSNELLNRIHEISINSQLSNVHGCVPMDCPHRERLGYTGDGQLSSLSVMYNFDAHEFYSKWITDIMDAQDQVDGFVPHTAPFNGGGGGPAWGSAIAVVPWNAYMQYGDLELLKKAHPHIRKWIEYLRGKIENGLITHEEDGSWCLGDWCMPSKYPWSNPHLDEIKLPNELVNTVYYIYCIDIYNKISDILNAPSAFSIERASSIDAVNKLINGNLYATGEQGSNIFPLFVGAVPSHLEAQVLDAAIERAVNNSYHFETGICGTRFLFDVLDKYERNDIALKMFLNPEYPGFVNMLKNGATALWETWEGNGSKNHTAFSSADAWLFYGLAGIKPFGGYKEFSIKPYFAKELDHLNASLECEYGTITLNWVRKGENIEVEINIPFNTTAHINLNGKCFDLDSGNYKELI